MPEKQPEVKIKFIKKKGGHGGAHGGAWKVAYADLVTAMMAFFLLMWLLNMTPQEVRSGVAGYMREGQVFFSTEAGQAILAEYGRGILPGGSGVASPGDDGNNNTVIDDFEAEMQRMEAIRIAIEEAFDSDSFLSAYKDQISIDFTEEGMRIQIRDRDERALFDSGSDTLKPFAVSILSEIAKAVATLKNHVVVGGHTDSVPFMRAGQSNWDLSSARANSALRTILSAGMSSSQVKRVVGYAETIPLDGREPIDPQNRRISIVVLTSRYAAREEAAMRQTTTSYTRRPDAGE